MMLVKYFSINCCNIFNIGVYMSKFSERLKELRTEAGLSQDQLAKQVGLTHTAIGLWELDKRVPNLDAVIELAKFFKVSMDYICGLED